MRLIRAILIVCIVATACGTALAADARQLLPYTAGNRWEYSVREFSVMSIGDGTHSGSMPMEATGTSVVEIVSEEERRKDGSIVYLERETEAMEAGENSEASESVTECLSLVSSKGILCLATKTSRDDDTSAAKWNRYDPPLVDYSADLSTGSRWEIGIVRSGGIRIPIEARVLGRETVSVPAGTFGDCIKICATSANIRGTVGSGRDKASVKQGLYIHTIWVAAAVGIVREESLSQIKMSGKHPETDQTIAMTVTERKTMELQPGYIVK